MRVDAAGTRAGLELVAVEQPERASGLDRAAEQRVGRREDVQLLAVADAVEIDDALDRGKLAAQLRLVDVVARAGELDLLRGERDEPNAACELATLQRFRDPTHAFDSRCVVDCAGAVPHRVVVRAHDHMAVACAFDVGDHVALAAARQETAADSQADAHPVFEPRPHRRPRRTLSAAS